LIGTVLPRALRWLHRAEDALLALALGGLLLLAVAQIVLRVGFDDGLLWAEPISRAGVLWLAMLGALGAARQQRHIAIDAIPRLLPDAAWRVVQVITQFAAAALCAWAAWVGWGLLQSEREFPLPFVAGIESWVPMLVLPFGFGLLALRFMLSAFAPRPADEVAVKGEASHAEGKAP
jgi:TRAP-type C4-dicarboxylate transport system permease small subunit